MKNIFVCLKKSTLIVLVLCVMVLISHFILYSNVSSYKKVADSLGSKIFNGFNYKSSEYDDRDNIFFVSNLNQFISLGNNKPVLHLPSGEEYEIKSGIISFNIKNNFVIKPAGDGIVKSVGFLGNGQKYVEIKHSGNIITRYENLKIVGVGANFLVKSTSIIGSVEENSPLIFKIIKNGEILTNFLIEDGEIKWQN